ncbi:MAG TPA: DNA-binding protein [Hyphomonadaceae bacterium]|nr:DNA-binding protein [Hyphomonadaceae bacterium]
MTEDDFFTEEEVIARYRGTISLGTLRNWRSQRIGPTYQKVGKTVLYRRAALIAWDSKNTVVCTKAS